MFSLKCERVVEMKLTSTKAKFWDNVKSGDTLIFTYFLSGAYGSAAHIQVENRTTGEKVFNSALNLKSNMSKFVLNEEVVLETSILIKNLKVKTKAKFWESVDVGDVISFKYSLSGGYGYAPVVKLSSKKGTRDENPLSLRGNLNKFEYEELENEDL